jgi:hypothetical protein
LVCAIQLAMTRCAAYLRLQWFPSVHWVKVGLLSSLRGRRFC